MLITIVAVLCSLQGLCVEEIVTDSNLTPELTFQGCLAGAQAPLAAWKEGHPLYHGERWRVSKWKCVPGRYEPAGRA
jgi:hypothetical protein